MHIQPTGSFVAMNPGERQIQMNEQQAISQQDGVAAATGKATPGSEPSREDVAEAVSKINASLLGSARGLEFSIDEDTKGIVVKVIDLDTKEVLRQMPSQVTLDIAKSIDKTRGLLIDHTA